MVERKYIENPKTIGSGIYAAIPQKGVCPMGCKDCFYNSGRSYLEPLEEHLPNLPDILEYAKDRRVIRVNDGHDSNTLTEDQIRYLETFYPTFFYNTSIPKWAMFHNRPFVLTINPGEMTDKDFHKIDPPKNLMFVRFRANLWNIGVAEKAVEYYSQKEVPIIMTFMAYHTILDIHSNVQFKQHYLFRKRTLNSYYAITTEGFETFMFLFKDNKWVYSCGKIEGEKGDTHCRFCGNCLREFFAATERLEVEKDGEMDMDFIGSEALAEENLRRAER